VFSQSVDVVRQCFVQSKYPLRRDRNPHTAAAKVYSCKEHKYNWSSVQNRQAQNRKYTIAEEVPWARCAAISNSCYCKSGKLPSKDRFTKLHELC